MDMGYMCCTAHIHLVIKQINKMLLSNMINRLILCNLQAFPKNIHIMKLNMQDS